MCVCLTAYVSERYKRRQRKSERKSEEEDLLKPCVWGSAMCVGARQARREVAEMLPGCALALGCSRAQPGFNQGEK
jgi:hypothetical protein